jgi:hypothetical protein
MTNQYDEFLGHMWEEIQREFSTQDFHRIREVKDRTDLEFFVADVRTQSRDYTCQPRSKTSKIRVAWVRGCFCAIDGLKLSFITSLFTWIEDANFTRS